MAIVNPRSRGGFTPAGLDRLRATLAGAVEDVLVSAHAGHVETLVAQCRTASGILVAGGDGTLFEVLQGCDRDRQRLGILPFGRGNSLARDLDLMSTTSAIASIDQGMDRAIDLLDVTLRASDGSSWRGVSASNLALGYPADVAERAARLRWMRGLSYVAAGLVATPHSVTSRVCVTHVPGDRSQEETWRFTGIIISNSRYVGPFLGFPTADLADGVFHTMELGVGRLQQWAHNLSAATGWRFYEPGLLRDLRKLRLTFETPQPVVIDGELRDDVVDVDVGVLRRAVTFRVPAGGAS